MDKTVSMTLTVTFYSKEYGTYNVCGSSYQRKSVLYSTIFWLKKNWLGIQINLLIFITYLYVDCKFLIVVRRPSFNGPVKTDQWASLRGLKEEICYCGRKGRSIENCSFFSTKLDFSHHMSPALSFLLRQHYP